MAEGGRGHLDTEALLSGWLWEARPDKAEKAGVKTDVKRKHWQRHHYRLVRLNRCGSSFASHPCDACPYAFLFSWSSLIHYPSFYRLVVCRLLFALTCLSCALLSLLLGLSSTPAPHPPFLRCPAAASCAARRLHRWPCNARSVLRAAAGALARATHSCSMR